MKVYLQIVPATYIASQGMLADAMNRKCSAKVVVVPVTCVVRAQLAYHVQWVEASVFLNLLKSLTWRNQGTKNMMPRLLLVGSLSHVLVFGVYFLNMHLLVICCVVISTLVSPNASKLRKSQR